jgi:hypothetical protein
MPRTLFPLYFLALLSLSLTSPIPLHAWELESGRLVPVIISAGIKSDSQQQEADLAGNGKLESLVLTNGHLDIMTAGKIVWQSPNEWEVIQAVFADLNRDGSIEATLLVWRPFRPWPVDRWLPHGGRIATFHNKAGYSCQIILIGWKNGQYREMWAGSALAEPVTSLAAADLNNDGVQELVTLDNDYGDPRSAPARYLKIWQWNGFGFTIVSKLSVTISKMTLARTSDNRILILVP